MQLALEMLNGAIAVLLIGLAWEMAMIGDVTIFYMPAPAVLGGAALVLLTSSVIRLQEVMRQRAPRGAVLD